MSTIAVMVAMDAELVHLRNLSPFVAERSVGIWDAFDLRIGSHEVVAVRFGIGMLNAATTSLMRSICTLSSSGILSRVPL